MAKEIKNITPQPEYTSYCTCKSKEYYFQNGKCYCPDCGKLIKSKYKKI
jgi:hypothetical protein